MMDQKPSRPAPVQKEYLPPVSRSFVASPGERLARWVLDMKLSPPDTRYKTPGDSIDLGRGGVRCGQLARAGLCEWDAASA